jgi:hypothetical protein
MANRQIEITPEMMAAAIILINTLLQLGIEHYQQTGEVATVDKILARNASLQAKIDAEKP